MKTKFGDSIEKKPKHIEEKLEYYAELCPKYPKVGTKPAFEKNQKLATKNTPKNTPEQLKWCW